MSGPMVPEYIDNAFQDIWDALYNYKRHYLASNDPHDEVVWDRICEAMGQIETYTNDFELQRELWQIDLG